MQKHILVTGGCGFIGYNLCKKLLEDGHMVTCFDNLSTGTETNLRELICYHDFLFERLDVSKPIKPKKIERLEHIDEIYHLACPASPSKYQSNPMKTIKTCINGSINVLKICKKYKCKLLFTSTSEIYGDPTISPQPETYWGNVNCIGKRSCYDESKRMCETIIYEYRKKHDLDLKVVRIFNTYGPYMDLNDGRVITNYVNCALNDKPITIYGDGNQTRSFCYVDDMVDALMKMMESSEQGPINLGHPDNELTMNKLADIFDELLNKKHQRIYLPLPSDDPKQRKPDITLAKTKLNWYPTTDIRTGISKLIEYVKENNESQIYE